MVSLSNRKGGGDDGGTIFSSAREGLRGEESRVGLEGTRKGQRGLESDDEEYKDLFKHAACVAAMGGELYTLAEAAEVAEVVMEDHRSRGRHRGADGESVVYIPMVEMVSVSSKVLS